MKVSEIITYPIVPLLAVAYIGFEINHAYMGLIIIGSFIMYKLFKALHSKASYVYNTMLVTIDWFLLDVLNIYTNGTYSYLNSSILETVLKNSLHQMI